MCVYRSLALLGTLLLCFQLSAAAPETSRSKDSNERPNPVEAFLRSQVTNRVAINIAFAVTDQENATLLHFGVNPNATNGYDSSYDVFAPPPPPSGAFDARLKVNSEDFLTDIQNDNGESRSFRVAYQAEDGAGPIVLSWDPSSLAGLGTFQITDDITGKLYGPLDMSSTSTLEVASAGGVLDSGVRILYTPPSGNALPIAVDDSQSTDEDTSVIIDILANDTDDSGLNPASVTIVTAPTRGTIESINQSTGAITFVPELDYNGLTDFSYTVEDFDEARSQIGIVQLEVLPVNDAPEFTTTPFFTAAENTPYEFVARTFDVDTDPVSITLDTAPDWLSIQDHNDGTATISGTPGPLDQGPHDVVLIATDGAGGSVDLAFMIQVSDNRPPLATNDFFATNEETPFGIDVLANDSDPEGDALNPASILVISTPAHGTLSSFDPITGKVTYTPAADYSGLDQFSYSVEDENGGRSNPSTVEITISEVNDRPVAFDDSVVGEEDNPLQIGVLSNDVDPDNSLAFGSVTIVTLPAQGSILGINPATGAIQYLPSNNYTGPDSFSYLVRDISGATSNVATVSISITPVNDSPIFAAIAPASALRGESFSLQLSAYDPDGDAITFVGVSLPNWLSLTGSGNGSAVLSGSPGLADVGANTVELEVRDPSDLSSNQSFVISVSDNAAPEASNDIATTDEDVAVIIDILSNDSDPEGDDLLAETIAIVQQPNFGTITDINPLSGHITYLGSEDFNGTDTFSYIVSDQTGSVSREATVSVTIVPVNDTPIAAPDQVSLSEDQSVLINLISNDIDVDGDLGLMTILIESDPDKGTVSNIDSGSGTVTYSPDPDFFGQDQFKYSITDPSGSSSEALVTVQVTSLNDPVVFLSSPLRTATPTYEYIYNVETVDVDGDTVTLSAISAPAWLRFADMGFGRALLSGSPELSDRGVHNVVIEADDGSGSIVHQSFVIKVSENVAPFGLKDTAETNEDIPVAIDVLRNDVDPNGDDLNPASVIISSPPSKGTIVSIDPASGRVTYLPNANYYGFDEFLYTVSDDQGMPSNPVKVEIIIDSVNDAPIAARDIAVTDEDSPVIVAVLYNDVDAEHDLISVVGNSQATFGLVTSQGDGSFRYVPTENYTGVDHFTYLVSDPSGAQSEGTVTVYVLPVNDPSEFLTTPALFGTVGIEYQYGAQVYDLDGDELVFTLTTQPDWLTFEDRGDGTAILSGTPEEHHEGTHRVVLDVHDGTGTIRQIFSIIVSESTLPPPAQVTPEPVEEISQPELLSPRLSWSQTDGASHYHVQLSSAADSLFQAPLFENKYLLETYVNVSDLVDNQHYIWRVRGLNVGGAGEWSDVLTYSTEDISGSTPNGQMIAKLGQNYPNPFNPSTVIPFELSSAGDVSLTIYDMLGRQIDTLVDGYMPAGPHDITWDANRIPSGMYIYRLQAGDSISTKTLSLIR